MYGFEKITLKLYNRNLSEVSFSDLLTCSVERQQKRSYHGRTKDRYIYSYISITTALYTLILSNAIAPFNCYYQDIGKYTMVNNPSQFCYDDEWRSWIPLVSMFLVLYALMLPGYVSFILYKYRLTSTGEEFHRFYGSLTRPYNEKFFFWELIAISKKVTLLTFSDFLSFGYSSNESKVFVIASVLFFFLAIEQYCRPFRTNDLNSLMLL